MSLVRKNILILFIIQGTNYIFPLLTIPYLSRIFGPTGMGALALSQAVILYLVMLIDFGFNLTVTRRISIANENKNQEEINKLFTHTIFIKLFFLILAAILILILCEFIPQFNSIRYLIYIGFISLLGATLNPIWLYQGLQKMGILLIPTTLSKVASLLLIFVFIHNDDDINLAMFFTCLGLLLSGLISIAFVFKLKLAEFCKLDYDFSKKLVLESSYVFISYLGSSIYTTMNTFIMSFFVGLKNIGIYSSADKVITTSQSLMGPLNQAIFPNLSSFGSKEEYLLNLKKFGTLLAFVGFIISLSIFLCSKFIISLLYGNEFYESYKILEILSILPFVISLGIIFGQWGLIVIGEAKVLGRIYVLGGVSHLFHIFILIYYYDIYGAALSIIITESLVSFMLFLAFCKKIKQWN